MVSRDDRCRPRHVLLPDRHQGMEYATRLLHACTPCLQAHPLRLWDACSGTLRCSYRSYNCKDEITAPLAVACSPLGVLLAGLNRRIDVFDLATPGRDCHSIPTGQRRAREDGQVGLISTLAINAQLDGVFAAGCYDGSVGVYDHRTLEQQLLLTQGHEGGVTQVVWSRDGNYLYSAARRDVHVFCWDVRFVTGAVYSMQRDAASTNQRIAVDIEPVGRHLLSGGVHGQVGTGACGVSSFLHHPQVDLFDLRDGSRVGSADVAPATVNGVHFHPYLPLLATASGMHVGMCACVALSLQGTGGMQTSCRMTVRRRVNPMLSMAGMPTRWACGALPLGWRRSKIPRVRMLDVCA